MYFRHACACGFKSTKATALNKHLERSGGDDHYTIMKNGKTVKKRNYQATRLDNPTSAEEQSSFSALSPSIVTPMEVDPKSVDFQYQLPHSVIEKGKLYRIVYSTITCFNLKRNYIYVLIQCQSRVNSLYPTIH
jgi:hypothetical protein